jgi:hypothetical protein
MNYSIKIDLSIFKTWIILIYAETLEDCSKIARVSYDLFIDYSDTMDAVTQNHGNKITICMPMSSYLKDPSILIHETNHAAFGVLQTIGARVSNDTEEVICYLQQYIYKELVQHLNSINLNDKP